MQENADVAHKYSKMFCDKNQFISFKFCVPHTKLNGVIILIKHYYM